MKKKKQTIAQEEKKNKRKTNRAETSWLNWLTKRKECCFANFFNNNIYLPFNLFVDFSFSIWFSFWIFYDIFFALLFLSLLPINSHSHANGIHFCASNSACMRFSIKYQRDFDAMPKFFFCRKLSDENDRFNVKLNEKKNGNKMKYINTHNVNRRRLSSHTNTHGFGRGHHSCTGKWLFFFGED